MPGDPKECRQHALNCVHLAEGASAAEQRDHLASSRGHGSSSRKSSSRPKCFLPRLRPTSQPSRSARKKARAGLYSAGASGLATATYLLRGWRFSISPTASLVPSCGAGATECIMTAASTHRPLGRVAGGRSRSAKLVFRPRRHLISDKCLHASRYALSSIHSPQVKPAPSLSSLSANTSDLVL